MAAAAAGTECTASSCCSIAVIIAAAIVVAAIVGGAVGVVCWLCVCCIALVLAGWLYGFFQPPVCVGSDINKIFFKANISKMVLSFSSLSRRVYQFYLFSCWLFHGVCVIVHNFFFSLAVSLSLVLILVHAAYSMHNFAVKALLVWFHGMWINAYKRCSIQR